MNVSQAIRQALKKRGLRSLKESASYLDISTELLRLVLNNGHLPKDKTLRQIANALGLDAAALMLAAHHQRLPKTAQNYVLAPGPSPYKEGKRVFPLSQEQCDYLGKIMTSEEIQLVRKYRQVNEEAKIQIHGCLEYAFAMQRKPIPPLETNKIQDAGEYA